MIITTSHASFIDGKIYEAPANTLVEILKNKKEKFIFIRHSMDGNLSSILYYYEGGNIISEKKMFVISKLSVLRYITEIISTFFHFLFAKQDNTVYIGVDPLNCFTGIMLKKVGKVKKVVFYTADYSPNRFKNPLLNSVYHLLDRFCVRNSDEVWSVSSRIHKVREKIGISQERNIFVPNVPSDEYEKYVNNRKAEHQLITLGLLGDQLDFIGIFDAVKELKNTYPDIVLKIAGNGPKEEEYKKYIKDNNLEEQVKFLGHLNHDTALSEISQSSIGLALYNGKWSFNYYGDSMKCREYFCFGLPVITTDTHSTVDDVRDNKAGVVCKMDKNDYIQAIIDIFTHYQEYSQNSYSLSKKYDNIHTKLLERL